MERERLSHKEEIQKTASVILREDDYLGNSENISQGTPQVK
jgi:hypothetical protein